jgi:hypothetical protein
MCRNSGILFFAMPDTDSMYKIVHCKRTDELRYYFWQIDMKNVFVLSPSRINMGEGQ